jgi:dTDP-4-amino-4,6-dideoxygalactose transaminase
VIPLVDPEFGPAEREAIAEVLESGTVADGPEVRRFEDEFADYVGATHGVATANGTAALHAALEAVGLGEGDRVVTTPFSFVASANAIRLAGATPVFADVRPDTFNLDPEAARAAVRATDADAVLAVHLYGLPAALDELAALADAEDVLLVEDAAQAHGASFDGSHVGTVGDVATFSFYPTKNMTTGEGGMIVTDRDDVAGAAERYVNHGRPDGGGYAHESLGHNYRMTSIAAAIGRVQLERLPGMIATRRRNARRLTESLGGASGVTVPREPDDRRHAFHQYTVRAADRDRLREALATEGVDAGVYYPTPIHRLGASEGVDASAPVAEAAAEEVLSLPVHPGLSRSDVEDVGAAVERATPRPR